MLLDNMAMKASIDPLSRLLPPRLYKTRGCRSHRTGAFELARHGLFADTHTTQAGLHTHSSPAYTWYVVLHEVSFPYVSVFSSKSCAKHDDVDHTPNRVIGLYLLRIWHATLLTLARTEATRHTNCLHQTASARQHSTLAQWM